MLDDRSCRLLSAVNGLCANGAFRIVEEEELLGAFAPAEGMDGGRLRELIARLEALKYLEVRYAEDGEYCLRPLPAGLGYFERARGEKRETYLRRRDGVLSALAGGLLGGFLGALIACLAVLA